MSADDAGYSSPVPASMPAAESSALDRLLEALGVREGVDVEFKEAQGGFPKSLWESYSAFANTRGGLIVLGVDDDGTVLGLPDAARTRRNLFNQANDRQVVSVNLFSGRLDQVRIVEVGGDEVLTAEVPRAGRRDRPVFVKSNPLGGTFRRNADGDYKCSDAEVRRMMADSTGEPRDSQVLEQFGFDDIHEESLAAFRNRFSARQPSDKRLELSPQDFLEEIGGWRRERSTGAEGLTVAGLLMFGKTRSITDP